MNINTLLLVGAAGFLVYQFLLKDNLAGWIAKYKANAAARAEQKKVVAVETKSTDKVITIPPDVSDLTDAWEHLYNLADAAGLEEAKTSLNQIWPLLNPKFPKGK